MCFTTTVGVLRNCSAVEKVSSSNYNDANLILPYVLPLILNKKVVNVRVVTQAKASGLILVVVIAIVISITIVNAFQANCNL